MPELILAIQNYDTMTAISLINDKNTDLLQRDEFNRNVLHISCETGNSVVSQALLNTNINFIDQGEYGNYPLHCAVLGNDLNIIKKLIKKKHNPNAQNNNGDTPLHLAIKNGFDSIVEYLINICDINIRNNKHLTPLLSFTEETTLISMYLLLEHNAELYDTDNDNNNILHLCAKKEYLNINLLDIIELAFMCGISPEEKNIYNQSAFDIAFIKENTTFLNIFKEDSLDSKENYIIESIKLNKINLLDSIANDSFDYNIIKDYFNILVPNITLEMLKYLITNGFTLNSTDNKGMTILHYAVLHNQFALIQFLLNQNIDADIIDKDGNQAIHYGLKNENLFSVLMLIEHGVDLNHENYNGIIPKKCIDFNKIKILKEKALLHASLTYKE